MGRRPRSSGADAVGERQDRAVAVFDASPVHGGGAVDERSVDPGAASADALQWTSSLRTSTCSTGNACCRLGGTGSRSRRSCVGRRSRGAERGGEGFVEAVPVGDRRHRDLDGRHMSRLASGSPGMARPARSWARRARWPHMRQLPPSIIFTPPSQPSSSATVPPRPRRASIGRVKSTSTVSLARSGKHTHTSSGGRPSRPEMISSCTCGAVRSRLAKALAARRPPPTRAYARRHRAHCPRASRRRSASFSCCGACRRRRRADGAVRM